MPSHAEPNRAPELSWAVVAWTQFLVSITVIDKADMNRLPEFYTALVAKPWSVSSNTFGSVALLLNVVSLAFFAFSLMAWHTWDEDASFIAKYRSRARNLAGVGIAFWLFSFLALLFYLSCAFFIVAFVSFLIGCVYMFPVRKKT